MVAAPALLGFLEWWARATLLAQYTDAGRAIVGLIWPLPGRTSGVLYPKLL
jgi:hypothetical protein